MTQLSIVDLSCETQAGEATVIRFCLTLGYQGFQDIKMDLAIKLTTTESNDTSPLLDAKVSESGDAHAIGLKLAEYYNSNVLSETLNLLNMQQVLGIVDVLLKARNEAQMHYPNAIDNKQLIFATGEAGCGKIWVSAAKMRTH